MILAHTLPTATLFACVDCRADRYGMLLAVRINLAFGQLAYYLHMGDTLYSLASFLFYVCLDHQVDMGPILQAVHLRRLNSRILKVLIFQSAWRQ